ncbi:hypothetical protein E2C01_065631 [Portunus trituberculatus]|uniref:Uncharacterized protein n=1 Tax=Portunus trituberculatus TaxID=210409 RepID=A0A5B7HSA5_PORTR|nr:hypothetical protein [Portunus trituberculatus]
MVSLPPSLRSSLPITPANFNLPCLQPSLPYCTLWYPALLYPPYSYPCLATHSSPPTPFPFPKMSAFAGLSVNSLVLLGVS